MRDLLDYRSEFPILEHTTYLINHSLAAMPRKAEERLAEYARMWSERGIRAWREGWWTMPMTVGDQIGLHCKLQTNTVVFAKGPKCLKKLF